MVVLVFCSQAKEQLEAERARLLADVERLQTKLEAAQEKYIESNVKVSQLADRVERADYSSQLTSQQLHNQSGNVEALARSKVKNTPFLNWYSRNFSTVIFIVLVVFQAIDPIIKSTKNNKCSLIIRMQNGYDTHMSLSTLNHNKNVFLTSDPHVSSVPNASLHAQLLRTHFHPMQQTGLHVQVRVAPFIFYIFVTGICHPDS